MTYDLTYPQQLLVPSIACIVLKDVIPLQLCDQMRRSSLSNPRRSRETNGTIHSHPIRPWFLETSLHILRPEINSQLEGRQHTNPATIAVASQQGLYSQEYL